MRIAFHTFLAALLLTLTLCPLTAQADSAQPLAHVIKIRGPITPATYDLITRRIAAAEQAGADILILETDTPGGLYDTTKQIIQAIIESPVPVATYVSPSGAHAASAGTYILTASHIAAMTPGTNIGAATPIRMGEGEKDAKTDNVLERKILNDATAYIHTLAELRGRNVQWAKEAVRDAATLTERQALDKKAIDTIAHDLQGLLADIDGKTVQMKQGTTKTLRTKNARIEHYAPDWRTDMLEIIAEPNIAMLLMSVGSAGLIYEVTHPGMIVPGVVGGICLLLGLFAMNVLPISTTGVLLALLGIVLMTAEAFVPAFGILGIGGAIAFVAGGVMLIDSPIAGYGVDPAMLAFITVLTFGLLTVFLSYALSAQKRKPVTGKDELLSAIGEIVNWAGGKGEVRVTGEIWRAESTGFILKPGDKVDILDIDGLTLTVAPHKHTTEGE